MCVFGRVQLLVTLWTVAHQAPLSVGYSQQEYWSGLPFPPPGDPRDPGIKLASIGSPALQVDSLLLSHQGGPFRTMIGRVLKYIPKCGIDPLKDKVNISLDKIRSGWKNSGARGWGGGIVEARSVLYSEIRGGRRWMGTRSLCRNRDQTGFCQCRVQRGWIRCLSSIMGHNSTPTVLVWITEC